MAPGLNVDTLEIKQKQAASRWTEKEDDSTGTRIGYVGHNKISIMQSPEVTS